MPLHTASQYGWLAIVKYLTGRGADVHAMNKVSHQYLPYSKRC